MNFNDENLDYYKSIQGTLNCNSYKDELLNMAKNYESDYFNETFDTEINILVNGVKQDLIVIDKNRTTTTKKKIIAKIGETFNYGDIVDCYDKKWLVIDVDSNKEVHTVGTMQLCNCKLRWQNEHGDIIERYCVSEDVTQYSNGEFEYEQGTIPSFQQAILMSYDEETVLLNRGKRLMIEDEKLLPLLLKNNCPIPVFEITKANRINFTYFGDGLIKLTGTENQYIPTKDDKETLLCDYFEDMNKDNKDKLFYITRCNNNYTEYPDFNGNVKVGLDYKFRLYKKDSLDILKVNDWSIDNNELLKYITINVDNNYICTLNISDDLAFNLYNTYTYIKCKYNDVEYKYKIKIVALMQ